MSNILDEYEEQVSGISGTFQDVPIQKTVQTELDFWQNGKLTEEKPEAYPRLKQYWDYVNFGSGWSPTETPWSSAFISYVLRNKDFPKRSAHRDYISDIILGKHDTWQAFSIPKSDDVILNEGDVLIKPRSSSYFATHGDIVYKIEDNKAFLVGGNLGNSAKVTKIYQLDENNRVIDSLGSYKIILKKKRSTNLLIPLGIIAVVGLALTTFTK